MRVGLEAILNDSHLDPDRENNQRQVAISVSAIAPDQMDRSLPLNLCLILDHSGSMQGRPIEMVKKAAGQLIDRLHRGDRIAVVAFDHHADVIVANASLEKPNLIKRHINQLQADGGTAIDEGLKLGIEELAKGKQDTVSQAWLLTDGENEHGSNDRCLRLAQLATQYKLTINTLGFGDHWNQDVLEKIADAGGGTLSYIERPEQAADEFEKLFHRVQSVGLTNAYLRIALMPQVKLADYKPLAQVAPDAIELPSQQHQEWLELRLGDLMVDSARVVLANLYVGKLPVGQQAIAKLQVRYDDPGRGKENILSEIFTLEANVIRPYHPQLNPEIQPYILALAKYRQTQLAEQKLKQGDRNAAATLLQSAAKTALQMGDQGAATILQDNATRLQSGEDLSDADRKKTRIVSKTILQ